MPYNLGSNLGSPEAGVCVEAIPGCCGNGLLMRRTARARNRQLCFRRTSHRWPFPPPLGEVSRGAGEGTEGQVKGWGPGRCS